MSFDRIPWKFRHTVIFSSGVGLAFWLTGAPLQYIVFVLTVYPVLHLIIELIRR